MRGQGGEKGICSLLAFFSLVGKLNLSENVVFVGKSPSKMQNLKLYTIVLVELVDQCLTTLEVALFHQFVPAFSQSHVL